LAAFIFLALCIHLLGKTSITILPQLLRKSPSLTIENVPCKSEKIDDQISRYNLTELQSLNLKIIDRIHSIDITGAAVEISNNMEIPDHPEEKLPKKPLPLKPNEKRASDETPDFHPVTDHPHLHPLQDHPHMAGPPDGYIARNRV